MLNTQPISPAGWQYVPRRYGGAGGDPPFSSKAMAEKFACEHGGRVVTFEEIPHDYIPGDAAGFADDHGGDVHDLGVSPAKPD
ncbi:MAG: nitrous oxide reductase accessory protein NosL [Gammaproteobacteria bacterium]